MSITYRQGEVDREGHLIFPYRAVCDVHKCAFHGVFYGDIDAQNALDNHQCPEQFTGWGYKFMGMAEILWVELDGVIDVLKSGGRNADPESYHKTQGRAGGLAFALVQICKPYYADEAAISAEALARWKMRNGKMDYRPTPGFKYDPPIPGTPRYRQEHLGTVDGVQVPTYTGEHNSTPTEAPVSGRRRRAAAKPAKVLSALEIETIKKAGNAFPVKDLAAMYGVSEDAIRAAQV